MTVRAVRALRILDPADATGLEATILVGAGNANAAAIEAEVAAIEAVVAAGAPGPSLRLRRSILDMPAEIRRADLALTSAGGTVWELARYGCPSLVVATVPVEVLTIAGLALVGLFRPLGSERGLDEASIGQALSSSIPDRAWREAMGRLGPSLVDALGARRVALVLAGQAMNGAA